MHQAQADAKGLTKTGDGLPARQDQNDHDHDQHYKNSVANNSNKPATSANDNNPNAVQKNILEEIKRSVFGFIADPQKLAMAMDAMQVLLGGPVGAATPSSSATKLSDNKNNLFNSRVGFVDPISGVSYSPANEQLTTGYVKGLANYAIAMVNSMSSFNPYLIGGNLGQPVSGIPLLKYSNGMQAAGGVATNNVLAATSIALSVAGIVEGGVGLARGLGGRFGLFGGAEELGSAANITSHPLEGWTPQQVVEHTNQLGLKTPRDQLILWSGLGRGDAGIRLSQEYAAANGGITLEMTSGGNWLNQMDLFEPNSPFSPQEATDIWANVSKLTARQASGQVRSVLGQVQPRSIYMSQELIELNDNLKVLGIDELYLRPRYTFGSEY